MGKFSRSKGNREELGLVNYLTIRHYTARRIPLSGAMQGFKHDVEAEKDGVRYTFEMKSRKEAFKSIYLLYEKHRGTGNVVRFSMASAGPFVAIGTDFEEVKRTTDVHFMNLTLNPPLPPEMRTFERIVRLDKLRAGADYLVCKDNGKHRLFIRFWGVHE